MLLKGCCDSTVLCLPEHLVMLRLRWKLSRIVLLYAGFAKTADDNNRCFHPLFPVCIWNIVSLNLTSFLAQNSNIQSKWNAVTSHLATGHPKCYLVIVKSPLEEGMLKSLTDVNRMC